MHGAAALVFRPRSAGARPRRCGLFAAAGRVLRDEEHAVSRDPDDEVSSVELELHEPAGMERLAIDVGDALQATSAPESAAINTHFREVVFMAPMVDAPADQKLLSDGQRLANSESANRNVSAQCRGFAGAARCGVVFFGGFGTATFSTGASMTGSTTRSGASYLSKNATN